ncbi:MAG: hypothetical protein NVS1B4_11260 [Gemmatimonadaceae bacterium]
MPDWDAELKKVDRQLETMSDAALFPRGEAQAITPASPGRAIKGLKATSSFGVFARLVLSVALGVAMLFWPYAARCGVGLLAYIAATAVVAGSGVWSAVWTWRHGAGRAHVLSLLIFLWGMLLAGIEILPRSGYAKPTEAHPAIWACS